jgi:hypothetical protein
MPRISLEGFDYDSEFVKSDRPAPKVAAVSRTGGRMGTRRAADLSPEELEALLRTG